jgi:hypothetical protein
MSEGQRGGAESPWRPLNPRHSAHDQWAHRMLASVPIEIADFAATVANKRGGGTMQAIAVGLAASLISTAALAGPSMSTKWNTTSLNLDRCKQRAEDALREAGFRSVKVLQFSVFAERGDYSAMVRCATDKEVVFFVVAGPQVERTNRYVDDIGDGF